MDLSPKAIRYLLDALQHYRGCLDRRLEEDSLSDDDLADLANDQQYLAALAQDLQTKHEDLLKGCVSLPNGSAGAADRSPDKCGKAVK
jgi:hypothetical protein